MARDPGTIRRRRWLTLLGGSLLLVFGFAWLLRAGGLPVLPPADVIWRIDPLAVLVYSGIWLLTIGLKVWRWSYQLAPIGTVPAWRVFSATLVGNAAQLLLPLKTGEFVRPALIARGTPITFLAAVSTSATERIVDAVFGSLLLIVGLLNATTLDPLPERIGDLPVPARLIPVLGYSFAGLALGAVAVVVLFYIFREASARLIEASLGRISPRIGGTVQRRLGELAQGLALLSSPRNGGRYVATTALYWATYALGLWYLLRQCGFAELSLAQAAVVSGTLAFSFSLPNAPGFFGMFQVSVYAALAVFYPAEQVRDLGATAVFWTYVLQLGWSFLLAAPGAWLEHQALTKAR
ncbi:MAG: hypothetical protein RJA70_103 [Pseudomonadota bacterium]|jgi:hypothetical protein